jgi:predicted nucleic acid-binding Zn ribbon protein
MEKIGFLLEKTLKKTGVLSGVKASFVCGQWHKAVEEIFNARAAEESSAEIFNNKVLFVKVSSSGWAQEFQFQQRVLIKELNQRIGEELVERIVFKF